MTRWDHVAAQLEKELPAVTLLLGADHAALWSLACQVIPVGTLITGVPQLSTETARDIVTHAFIAPAGEFRYFVIGLSEASWQAQNILLKVLEEPPPRARFLLVSTRAPLPTVASRARVYRVEDPAMELTVTSEETEEGRKARAAVAAALKAAVTGNDELLSAAVRTWEPMYNIYLTRWALEASSGRWKMFSAETAPGATMVQARQLLEYLGILGASRRGPAVALIRTFSPEPG